MMWEKDFVGGHGNRQFGGRDAFYFESVCLAALYSSCPGFNLAGLSLSAWTMTLSRSDGKKESVAPVEVLTRFTTGIKKKRLGFNLFLPKRSGRWRIGHAKAPNAVVALPQRKIAEILYCDLGNFRYRFNIDISSPGGIIPSLTAEGRK